MLKIILICSLAVYALIYLILLIRTRKPIKNAFMFAILGIFITVILNLISPYTGFKIAVNPASVVLISALGVWGVVAMLILPFVFI